MLDTRDIVYLTSSQTITVLIHILIQEHKQNHCTRFVAQFLCIFNTSKTQSPFHRLNVHHSWRAEAVFFSCILVVVKEMCRKPVLHQVWGSPRKCHTHLPCSSVTLGMFCFSHMRMFEIYFSFFLLHAFNLSLLLRQITLQMGFVFLHVQQ